MAERMSQEERNQLDAALKRASAFERSEHLDIMRQPLEGMLLKFTNPILSWQPRWFILDPKGGDLRYFLKEEHRNASDAKPRGIMVLAGSTILPSEEDSQTFSVIPVHGDTYKLKAVDTRQRSEWMNRLRVVSQDESERKYRSAMTTTPIAAAEVSEPVRRGTAQETTILHQLGRVSLVANEQQAAMCRTTEALSHDQSMQDDVLILKASSAAVLSHLSQCQRMLESVANVKVSGSGSESSRAKPSPQLLKKVRLRPRKSSGGPRKESLPLEDFEEEAKAPDPVAVEEVGEEKWLSEQLREELPPVDPAKEVEVRSPPESSDPLQAEAWKGEVLALLSPLKLGTDLTRVAFPAACLRPQSLLQTLGDFFADAEGLIQAKEEETTELRLIALAKWYIGAFRFGLRGGLPKKPLNPLQDEVYRCTWKTKSKGPLKFYAEQVLHVPGVSCVYAEAEGVRVSGHLRPKAKFIGMNIAAGLEGETLVHFPAKAGRRAETFRLTYPTVFGRSILTTPSLELGGKVSIACTPLGASAAVTFHTAPPYAAKGARVSAEFWDGAGALFATAEGDWTGGVRFAFVGEGLKGARVDQLRISEGAVSSRFALPLEMQGRRESGRIWAKVRACLDSGDAAGAAAAKGELESAQRLRLSGLPDKPRPPSAFLTTPDGGWRHRDFPEQEGRV